MAKLRTFSLKFFMLKVRYWVYSISGASCAVKQLAFIGNYTIGPILTLVHHRNVLCLTLQNGQTKFDPTMWHLGGVAYHGKEGLLEILSKIGA